MSRQSSLLSCKNCDFCVDAEQDDASKRLRTHEEKCEGFACEICLVVFPRSLYRGSKQRAHKARNDHQKSHPVEVCCFRCGEGFSINYRLAENHQEAFALAKQRKDDHELQCGGFRCHQCAKVFNAGDYSGGWQSAVKARQTHEVAHWDQGTYTVRGVPRPDDEHGILLGVTRVDQEQRCLVAWHCEEQRPFRLIGDGKFWMAEDVEEMKIKEFGGFRFRRHSNQRFPKWETPHLNDNIRVFDVSPCSLENRSIRFTDGYVDELFHIARGGRVAEGWSFDDDESSFAIVEIHNLHFYRNENGKLRCSFRNGRRTYHEIPVANLNLQERVHLPTVADTCTAVLGVSSERFNLMLDSYWD